MRRTRRPSKPTKTHTSRVQGARVPRLLGGRAFPLARQLSAEDAANAQYEKGAPGQRHLLLFRPVASVRIHGGSGDDDQSKSKR